MVESLKHKQCGWDNSNCERNKEEKASILFLREGNIPREKKRKISDEYIDLGFIVPTSNCVERFFSVAKYVYSPNRQSLLPMNLEAVLFLKVNKALWDKKIAVEAFSEAKKVTVIGGINRVRVKI